MESRLDRDELERLKRLVMFGSVTARAVAFVELNHRFPGFLEKLRAVVEGYKNEGYTTK